MGTVDESRGKWLALAAALLGWMFDGFEMGLFPLVARPALRDLLGTTDEARIRLWFAVATAGFLVGAATGGVLFGWLGDRIGRVRAMMLSVLTYALFSGLCGLAGSAWQIAALRFVSALGMGGEWSLGVALVMEIWPDRSRAWLAGLIGAVGNAGYLLVALLGLVLEQTLKNLDARLATAGISGTWTAGLAESSGWRWLMALAAAPALLTFFIRLYVPESQRWQQEKSRGAASHWAPRDLAGVGLGALGAGAIIYLRVAELPSGVQVLGTFFALVLITLGYTYPGVRFLQRSSTSGEKGTWYWLPVIRRIYLGAALGGVALVGTWASIQWAPLWADQLTEGKMPAAKSYTQISSATGAIVGTLAVAILGGRFGRRSAYAFLCLGSLASTVLFFQLNDHFGLKFLAWVFVAGGFTASFYGWLPLYLPELFPTRMRATGQGFSFNFGRILAAIGVLQTGNLGGSYPQVCSAMSLIYVVGLGIIWLAPETCGQPLPE